jgi:FkbM family methyltransferase
MSDLPFGTYAPSGFARFLMGLARKTPVFGGFVRKLAWRALAASGRPCYDIERNGARFRAYPHDDAVARHLLLKRHAGSPLDRKFFAAALAGGGTLVDAGAHIGTMSLPYARLPGVSVLAIEPNPTALARLRYNIAANGLSNVTVAPVALSDRDGTVRFGADPHNIGESEIGRPTATQFDVPSRTLRSVLAEAGITGIAALKLDIQFQEDAVMLPFFAEADRSLWPRHVLIESIDNLEREPAAIGLMKAKGYREVHRTHQNVALSLD